MNHRSPRNADIVELGDPHEVAYWTRHFAVSEEDLRTAVHTHGSSLQAVAAALGKVAE